MTIATMMLLAAAAGAPGSKPCSPEVYAALTAPRKPGEKPYRLMCSVTLKSGDSIPRRLMLMGPSASGITIDCADGTIGFPGIGTARLGGIEASKNPFDISTIVIASQPVGDGWTVPTDVSIRRCRVLGNIQTSGISTKQMQVRSRSADFTAFARRNAPSRITISDSVLVAFRAIPLYVGVGTTRLTLRNSRVEGDGDAAVYFDLETGYNRLVGNQFAMQTRREMIAVDASAHNEIIGNRFALNKYDGVHLYRNCGEAGIVRHQTPSHNRITGNRFTVPSGSNVKPVVVNARTGQKFAFCGAGPDASAGEVGTAVDGGVDNVVSDNRVVSG